MQNNRLYQFFLIKKRERERERLHSKLSHLNTHEHYTLFFSFFFKWEIQKTLLKTKKNRLHLEVELG